MFVKKLRRLGPAIEFYQCVSVLGGKLESLN